MAISASRKLSEERQALEHTRSFRWRAGIEGRIASRRRDYRWRKSTYHGQKEMKRWLGTEGLANNLSHIAQGSRAVKLNHSPMNT